MKREKLRKMILSAIFLCVGIVLPVFTMQIKEIGDSLLPMHLPVMLCGLICGKYYGLTVGLILPFFRSVLFSMPPLYPNAIWMSAELCAYGFIIGLVFSFFKNKDTLAVYISLISSMIAGRIIWGVTKAVLLGIGGKTFTVIAFLTGGFVDSALGILLQLVLIPFIINIIKRLKR